jgi:hypothetical protein
MNHTTKLSKFTKDGTCCVQSFRMLARLSLDLPFALCRLESSQHAVFTTKNLCFGNAFLTMTLGVGAFLAPATAVERVVFDGVNEVTKPFIHGYAAATMGYGYRMLRLGGTSSGSQRSTLLQASAMFNTIAS